MTDRNTLLKQAAARSREYLDAIDDRHVDASVTPQEIRDRFAGPLASTGENPAKVLDALAEAARDATVAMQGPRYFGFVVGSSYPVATAADWLVSAWDQNSGLYIGSPLVATIEQVTNGWIRSILGLGDTWSLGYVTGGTMANFTGLAAARHHVLGEEGWDVGGTEWQGQTAMRISVSSWATTDADVERSLEAMLRVADEVSSGLSLT